MLNPTLSIILPCYNYGHYLSESIDSILKQDYRDYEIIIIDDASTDNSFELIQKYASLFPQIKSIKNQKNCGIFETNKIGINEARGAYIHCFSADDRYLPDFLSNAMGFLLSDPEIPFICTDIAYFKDGQSDFSKEVHLLDLKKPVFFKKNEIVSVFQKTSFWIPGPGCIMKKEILHKYGWLDPDLENISDWFFLHNVALMEGIAYIPKLGVEMRLHDSSYTSQVKRNKKRTRATYWKLLNKLSKKENRELRTLFKKSTLLTFIFEALFWKLAIRPKYWDFFPYISKKYSISRRLFHLGKRKLQ